MQKHKKILAVSWKMRVPYCTKPESTINKQKNNCKILVYKACQTKNKDSYVRKKHFKWLNKIVLSTKSHLLKWLFVANIYNTDLPKYYKITLVCNCLHLSNIFVTQICLATNIIPSIKETKTVYALQIFFKLVYGHH